MNLDMIYRRNENLAGGVEKMHMRGSHEKSEVEVEHK